MPAKKPKPDVRLGDMKEKFLLRAAELWDAHIEKAMRILDEGENRVVTLNFSAQLDFSESTAKETTSIRYTQAFTDRRQDDFEDPKQGRFGFAEGQTETPLPPAGDEGNAEGAQSGEAGEAGEAGEGGEGGETGSGEAEPGSTPPSEAAGAIARAKKRRGRPKKAK